MSRDNAFNEPTRSPLTIRSVHMSETAEGQLLDNKGQEMEKMDRIKTLEEIAAHLNNQMKIMKKLMTAQINEIKKMMEDQGIRY